MKSKRIFIVDLVCITILISLCLVIALPRYRAGIDWGDEGFLAYGAVRVMEGQMPNRDFVSLQPPLSFYIVAAIFKVCGVSLAVLRTFGLVLHVLVVLLIFRIATLIMPTLFALAAAIPATVLGLPTFGFVPFAVWQGIGFGLAALALYLYALFYGRRWLALPAGILSAAAVFSRHDQGLYLVLTFLALTGAMGFARTNSNPGAKWQQTFGLWLAGIAAASVLFLAFCWWRGALPDMFRQLVAFPFTTYRKTSSSPFPHFDPHVALQNNALALLFFLPPVASAVGTGWLLQRIWRRRFAEREAIVTFLVAWCALFYCQVLTRSDINHLLITLPPFFLLTSYAWCALHQKAGVLFSRETDRWRGRLVQMVVSVIIASAMILYLRLLSYVALPNLQRDNVILALPRGGVRIEQAQPITDFVRELQAYVPPTRSILSLPYQSMFYFLCERRNPTRWNYLWPGDQTARDHEMLIEQAKADSPAVVLLTNEQEMSSYAPAVLDYVHREYAKFKNYYGVTVYLERDQP
jgi:hypothetical protein